MGEAEDTFTKQEIQAGYVTSGRDVLARQQQLFNQNGGIKRKVGGGGPSGTGKVPSTPVFPPPVYEEPTPKQTLTRASSVGTPGSSANSTKRSNHPRSNSFTKSPNIIAATRKAPPANTTAAAVVAAGGGSSQTNVATTIKQSRNTISAQSKDPPPSSSTNNSRSATPTTMDSTATFDEGFIQSEIKSQNVVGAIGSSNNKKNNNLLAGFNAQQGGDGFIGGSILVSNNKTAPAESSVGVIGGFNLNFAAQDNSATPSTTNYLGTIGSKRGDGFVVASASSTDAQGFAANNFTSNDKKWNSKEDPAFGNNLFGAGSLGGVNGIWGEGSSNFLNPNHSDNRAPGSNNPNRSSESTSAVGGGVIMEPNHPFPVDSGSSALASMLGIDLPTGSGSLRDNALNFPTAPQNNFYNSNAIPIQAPSSSNNTLWNSNNINTAEQSNQYNNRNQGVIGSSPHRINSNGAVGGVAIGGGRGYSNLASTNNDIALLQSLLPGVHITSGSAHQPAAPNTMWGGGAQTAHNPVIGSRSSDNTDTWGNLSALHGGNNNNNTNNNTQQKNNTGSMPNHSSIW